VRDSTADEPTAVRLLTREPATGGELNAAITRAVVAAEREHVGRGPTRARTFYRGNVVVVILGQTMTRAERKLVDAGRGEAVLAIRRELQETMRSDLTAAVERLTRCGVVAFMSASHLDPDLAVEVFVLDRPVPGEPFD
jgi:uncharacterized protein YbcI